MADQTTTPTPDEKDGKQPEPQTSEEQGAETKTNDSKPESNDSVEENTNTESNDTSKEEQSSETEDSFDYEAWLDKKGIDPSTPEGKAQVAKSWRELEKKMHTTGQSAAELRKQVEKQAEENADPGETPEDTQTRQLLNKLAVTDFYLNNPEARQYDGKMAEILQDKPYLASDLDTLLVVAKARTSEAELLEREKKGRKSALESAAQSQRQGSPARSATSQTVNDKPDPIMEGLNAGFGS